mmetsp:Transcript_48528/g.155767  ORF Transcript_48528/g.155767 Transcript_48528/m.155767 type:complete len:299 (-) Transcript_48528:218-1114(-)
MKVGAAMGICTKYMDYAYPIGNPAMSQHRLPASAFAWAAPRVASWQRFEAFSCFFALLLTFRTSSPVLRGVGVALLVSWCFELRLLGVALFWLATIVQIAEHIGVNPLGIHRDGLCPWTIVRRGDHVSRERALALEAELRGVRRSFQSALSQLAERVGGEIRVLNPHEIRFTHNSISLCFRSNATLDTTIQNILQGELSHEEFPPLEVVRHDNNWYSISNRRLFVLRVLATRGLARQVSVIVLDMNSSRMRSMRDGKTKWDRSFSTTNGGLFVKAGRCGICGKVHSSKFDSEHRLLST